MSDGHRPGSGVRLRLARQARGFSQQQLAGMAGVSRQAVSAVESGLSDPSLRVALALGRALGMTVEDLFGPAVPALQVVARPVAPLGGKDARVTLAPMGDGIVALPLSGATVSRAGFLPAGGLAAGTGSADSRAGAGELVQPVGPLRPTLVVAGCDPALPLLESPLGLLDPPVAFSWWPCPSQEALGLAAEGLVHAAGAHLRGLGREYNIGPAADLLPHGGEVIGFCSWREGLVLRPELAGAVCNVGDVARRGNRLDDAVQALGSLFALDPQRRISSLNEHLETCRQLLCVPGYRSSDTARELEQKLALFSSASTARALPGES
jgi:DNA-binding XRE family transcriptional regulator